MRKLKEMGRMANCWMNGHRNSLGFITVKERTGRSDRGRKWRYCQVCGKRLSARELQKAYMRSQAVGKKARWK